MILVGEMRDVETARIAVQSALTGHLVLSSIHATDAVSALLRFLDMGIENFLVASSVLAVVGPAPRPQDLRRLPGAVQAVARGAGVLHARPTGRPKKRFYRGEGCNFCAHTGYQERIGVYEVLVIDEALRQLIVHGGDAEQLRAYAVASGMRTLQRRGHPPRRRGRHDHRRNPPNDLRGLGAAP